MPKPAALLALALLSPIARADWQPLYNAGRQQLLLGHYSQAAELAGKALAEAHASQPGGDAEADSLRLQAEARASLNDKAAAEAGLRQALALREARHGGEQTALDADLLALARFYDAQHRFAEAGPLYRRRVDIFNAAYGGDHPAVAERQLQLADFEYRQGHYATALPLYRHALDTDRVEYGKDARATQARMAELAGLYTDMERYSDAADLYEDIIAAQEDGSGTDPVYLAHSREALARVYLQQQKFRAARRQLQKAARAYGELPAAQAVNLTLQGDTEQAAGQLATAAGFYQQALSRFQALPDPTPSLPAWADLLLASARNSAALGKPDQAASDIQQATVLYRQTLGPGPALAEALSTEGDWRLQQSQPAAAEALLQEALAMRQQVLGPDHPAVAASLQAMARLAEARQQKPQAVAYLQAAATILERACAGDCRLAEPVKARLAALQAKIP